MAVEPPELSLIIPAYNESGIIVRNVTELDAWMRAELPDVTFEMLVVDDGSTDGMADQLKAKTATLPGLRVVSHGRNRGRGRAIRTGFEASRGAYVICLDADLSYAPSHIPRLLEPLRQGRADITLASAYHPEGSVENVPFTRLLMSRVGNRILSSGFKGDLHTVTCIVRGFSREAINTLELINDGKDLHLEIIQKAELFGLRLVEVPAHLIWRDRNRGKKKKRRLRDFIPFLSMSGTMASHLVYSYVLRPAGLLNIPLFGLMLVAAICIAGLAISFLTKLADPVTGGFSQIYSVLRETLLQGQLTALVLAASLIFVVILLAFYFASQQNKRHHDEMYILLSRMNARIKELERRQAP